MSDDNWRDVVTYCCETCRFFVAKNNRLGRCRRHAPTLAGWPVMYPSDWCGDHKLDHNKPDKSEGGVHHG